MNHGKLKKNGYRDGKKLKKDKKKIINACQPK
jgi:hypothetical protein